jgi:hypothetical protein
MGLNIQLQTQAQLCTEFILDSIHAGYMYVCRDAPWRTDIAQTDRLDGQGDRIDRPTDRENSHR